MFAQLRQYAFSQKRCLYSFGQFWQAASLFHIFQAFSPRFCLGGVLFFQNFPSEMGRADDMIVLVLILGQLLDGGQVHFLAFCEDVR
jgi:hypothetical protein